MLALSVSGNRALRGISVGINLVPSQKSLLVFTLDSGSLQGIRSSGYNSYTFCSA